MIVDATLLVFLVPLFWIALELRSLRRVSKQGSDRHIVMFGSLVDAVRDHRPVEIAMGFGTSLSVNGDRISLVHREPAPDPQPEGRRADE